MHGRLKLKEKAEIEAEKKKKYEEKAARFKSGLDFCLKSKANYDYNDEVMRISWDLIVLNPDVYSIWNIRKEFIMMKKEEYEKQLEQLRSKIKEEQLVKQNDQEQANPTEKSNDFDSIDSKKDSAIDNQANLIEQTQTVKSIDESNSKELSEEELSNQFQKLCDNELELSEYALLKNPKSYPAWQHRLFILSLMPRPNFQHEFNLNEAYLQKDGRNLHCWHFRTNLCKISNRDLQAEIKFSLDRIKDNLSAFSYSTLYYRSLTLTKASNSGLIAFGKWLDEYNLIGFSKWLDEYILIENALYTEPSDQALWFYLRWLLLTNFGQSLGIGRQDSSANSLIKVIFNKEAKLLIFYFNDIVKEFPYVKIDLLGNDILVKSIKNENFKSIKYRPSKLWFVKLDVEVNLDEIHLENKSSNEKLVLKLNNLNNYQLWNDNKASEISKLRKKIYSERDEQLKLVLKSLLDLKQIEPDNKWLNLILSYFENVDQLQILDDLIKLDPLRTNYYKDQKSKIHLEKFFSNLDLDQTTSDLSNFELTVFYTPEQFAHLSTLNLSANRISFLNSNFNCLISLKNLILDDNLLYRIDKKFNLINLEALSLRNNKLTNRSGIENLINCPKLKVVYLSGNNLSENDLVKLKNRGINCDLQS